MMSKEIYFALTIFILIQGSYCLDEGACAKLTVAVDEDCCGQDGCIYISCMGVDPNTTEHKGCHSNTTDLTTKDICSSNPKNLCGTDAPSTAPPDAPTTTPPDACTALTDCCADDTCRLVTCNQMVTTAPTPGCHSKTDTLADACVAGSIVNTCPTPPPTPTTTTIAPTPTCADYTTDCCSHTGCLYINCTDTSSKPLTVCFETDKPTACDLDQPRNNICPPNTTTTTTTTTTTAPPTSTEKDNSTATGGDKNAKTGGDSSKQHFDAGSFIGGIVLCAGIMILAFVGRKIYIAKTEKNYHTLH